MSPSLAPLEYAQPSESWDLSRRLRIAREKNANHQCNARCQDGRHKGRGTARRDRYEIRIRAAVKFLDELEQPYTEFGHDRHRVEQLLYARLERPAGAVTQLRYRIKARWSWCAANAPQSGWALLQARPGAGRRKDRWTPFYLPRASWKAARRWLQGMRELRRLLLLLAAWWNTLSGLSGVIPLHPPWATKKGTAIELRSSNAIPFRTGLRDRWGGPRALSDVISDPAM